MEVRPFWKCVKGGDVKVWLPGQQLSQPRASEMFRLRRTDGDMMKNGSEEKRSGYESGQHTQTKLPVRSGMVV